MNARTLMILASATGILLAGSAAVTAAPGGPGGRLEKMLERVDTDQSGTISLEEFSTRADERFAAQDADNNGMITAEELQAAKDARKAEREEKAKARAEERMQSRLEKIDTDGDGVISLAEHQAEQAQRFAALDADGNGEVTTDEFAAQMMKMRKGGKRGGPAE